MKDETPVLGLEIHLQLLTQTKAFCNCRNAHSAHPNTDICPVCMGLPGAMPMPSDAMFLLGIKLALALNSTINRCSRFDRKNYFYPDLPKGYQITQHFSPLAKGGAIFINETDSLALEEIHLEEDSGRIIHNEPYVPEGKILIDYNRAGIPLAEVVTLPQKHSIEQVIDGLRNLQKLVRWLKISDAEMSNGSMRVDVNVSLDGIPGRTEIKNLNSFKAVKAAVEAEIAERKKIIMRDEILTKGWNETDSALIVMRKKEELPDYRYLPEPDIFPVQISEEKIATIQKEIGELPWEMRRRFMEKWQLDEETARELTKERDTAEYYLKLNDLEPVVAARIMRRFLPHKKKIAPDRIREIINELHRKNINFTLAEKIISELEKHDAQVLEIIESKQLFLIKDRKKLQSILDELKIAHEKEFEELCAGNRKMVKFFTGLMMQKTKRRAEPEMLKIILEKQIKELL